MPLPSHTKDGMLVQQPDDDHTAEALLGEAARIAYNATLRVALSVGFQNAPRWDGLTLEQRAEHVKRALFVLTNADMTAEQRHTAQAQDVHGLIRWDELSADARMLIWTFDAIVLELAGESA